MMYSGLPMPHRAAVKTSLATAWLLAGGAGLSAIIFPPVTIVAGLGGPMTAVTGCALAAAAFTAALGVVMARYRWEWLASWVASAALAPYAATIWALVFTGEPTRETQALLASSLLAFFITRSVLCAAHAAKLREVHGAGTGLIDLIENGDTDGDTGSGPGG
jgi:hypothetical protein